MKRIVTLQDKEKKDRRSKIIIGVVLAFLMLASTAGYAIINMEKTTTSTNSGKVSYRGLDFYNNGGLWTTQIQGYQFVFHYLPNETETTSINKTLNDFSGKTLYITNDILARQEISTNIGNFVQRIQTACYSGMNCTGDFPEKDCSENLIKIDSSNASISLIYSSGNCIFMSTNDSVRSADAFLFKILGIK